MGGELLPLPLAISTSLIENSINSINVYPNPAIDQITIEGSSNLTGNIIDQSGKVVLSFISNKVDISELSKGVYFINILDNETISTQKLIKQ